LNCANEKLVMAYEIPVQGNRVINFGVDLYVNEPGHKRRGEQRGRREEEIKEVFVDKYDSGLE